MTTDPGGKDAEHPDINLPVMVMMDGFIISHGMENVYLLPDEEVRKFVGERKAAYTLLDADNPITVGPLDLQDFYFEHRRQQAEAMFNADKVVQEVADEFAKLSGRQYDFFESYRLDDAEMAIVVIGSTAGTAKYVVNELRAKESRPAC